MTNKGLGRGLGSLFGSLDDEEEKKPQTKIEPEHATNSNNVDGKPMEVDIGLIDRNPDQPRKTFNDEQISELWSGLTVC